ncbi:hypothetical protein OH807_40045 [Kitasatospora sp. NBC_01560]|uniref:hypothetical protein n=1 Tax=Kitasatospora sp. NBC_01560 TaxID=2975965 RepID=UPI00386DE4EC
MLNQFTHGGTISAPDDNACAPEPDAAEYLWAPGRSGANLSGVVLDRLEVHRVRPLVRLLVRLPAPAATGVSGRQGLPPAEK